MIEKHYHCIPQNCGCVDSIPCSFDHIDEEYVLRVRGKHCITSIENMFMVDTETQKQVEIIEQMEW